MAERGRLTSRLQNVMAEERAAAEPETPRVIAPEVPVKNVQLNIELPETMRYALRMKALARRTDASKVLRDLIQQWLDSEDA